MSELNYATTEPLEYIEELMEVGNWSDAQYYFKAINCSPRDFTDWLSDRPQHIKEDFALLGFYCREYKPLEGLYYG